MGRTITTYRFAEQRVRTEVKTFCPKCKKKMKRVLLQKFYDNGLHDVAETRKKYETMLSEKAKGMTQHGVLCSVCG